MHKNYLHKHTKVLKTREEFSNYNQCDICGICVYPPSTSSAIPRCQDLSRTVPRRLREPFHHKRRQTERSVSARGFGRAIDGATNLPQHVAHEGHVKWKGREGNGA